eukprot:TRINITY_DN1113_c0_g1_i1.p1 TRINITY_DN1113_c0_g1~~TRINITY_DN1113_c0_g1_i1.p1  ORF type:complete len:119 (-),score=21.97 TRINITY_DN1113_c0_g1_i1:171-527(-)
MSEISRHEEGPFYSKIVIYNKTVYLSGIIPEDSTFDKDLTAQMESVLSRVDEMLGKAGTNKSKLLTVNVYLSDIKQWSLMNESWVKWIDPSNKPARTTVEAKMTRPNILVEITVVAAQ